MKRERAYKNLQRSQPVILCDSKEYSVSGSHSLATALFLICIVSTHLPTQTAEYLKNTGRNMVFAF